MLETLRQHASDLRELRKLTKQVTSERIYQKAILDAAESASGNWFTQIEPALARNPSVSEDTIGKYHELFRKLVEKIKPGVYKRTLSGLLNKTLSAYRADLILPIQTSATESLVDPTLSQVLADLPDIEEGEYLKEAVQCAEHGFYRAAVVLGWCAAIDRIHRKVEQLGFRQLNVVSARMASEPRGRFKRFNQPQNVKSLSELRQVFDSLVLWIIEGMNLIDFNQHKRLSGCFDMRCQCSHPGDAPITKYNLMSFFSDICEIVLRNPRFAINPQST